jgi:hypothetical protein
MKNIAIRVASLEDRARLTLDGQRVTESQAAFDRLVDDEEGEAALLAYFAHMRAHHPDGPGQRDSVAADPRVGPLLDAIVLAARRANAGAWLAGLGIAEP